LASTVAPAIGSTGVMSIADHDARGAFGLDAFDGDLGPAAGRGPRSTTRAPGLRKTELIVELQELEGGRASVAALAGFGDIGNR